MVIICSILEVYVHLCGQCPCKGLNTIFFSDIVNKKDIKKTIALKSNIKWVITDYVCKII